MMHVDEILRAGAGRQLLAGPGGAMEVQLDVPAEAPRGLALVGHPQPREGGSAAHKVPHFLARGLQAQGWLAVRPNFRGVGASEGTHGDGLADAQDMAWLAGELRQAHPGLPLVLVGFSFGAFVMANAAHALAAAGAAPAHVVLAGAPAGQVASGRHFDPPPPVPGTLMVHGEQDERVGLAAVLGWCRPHGQPVLVVPGADHFFTGRLPLLRSLVQEHLAACLR